MGNVAGEQGLALQQHFPYKFPYSFKLQTHKISSFNDGGLKFDHFDILDMLFPFLAFVKVHLTPKFFFAKTVKLILWSNFMKSRSRDG